MANAKFTDRNGREWDLSLHVGLISKVRNSFEIDLGVILADVPATEKLLFKDPNQFLAVVMALTESQRKEPAVDQEQFESGFDGEAMRRARLALFNAIANFSHSLSVAEKLAGSLEKLLQARETLAVATIDLNTEKAINAPLPEISNKTATPSAESAG